MRAFLVLLGLATALPALGDASVPAHDDEPPAHLVKVPERRVEMPAVEIVASQAAAPQARALPIERLKREARADSRAPLAFVDDTIDSGELLGRLATQLRVRLEPAPRLPKSATHSTPPGGAMPAPRSPQPAAQSHESERSGGSLKPTHTYDR